jgi:hypothetical protein
MRGRLVVCAFALSCAVTAPAQNHLAPFVYRSHFEPNPGAYPESGSRDGWESFPLAQDAGYDPTLTPETTGGGSALVREMAPTRDGDFQLGFIRRMHMVAGEGAFLSASLRAPFASGSTAVGVSIFRGAHEERLKVTLRGREWQEIKLPIAASGEGITAVVIAADFPDAIRGRIERVLMRDVTLRGLAVQRIDLETPAALWDPNRELYYLQRTMHPGEDMAVRMSAEGGHDSAWKLSAPDGKEVAKGAGASIRHHFGTTAAPGVWTLQVSSSRAETTALLLLRPREKSGLLFDKAPNVSDDLLALVRKRREQLKATTYVDAGMNIAQMDPHWLLAGLPSYFATMSKPAELAMLNAIEFRVSGDRAALQESLSQLNGIAKWPLWVHPWFPAHGYHSYYPVGIMTKYVVMAMQFLGDSLPAEERKKLDRSLMELSAKPIYEEYVLEDRLGFNTSNWIGNTVGGALLAALQSDDPNSGGYALGLYVKERDHVREAYTADGSYGEGGSYQKYDLEMTALVAAAAHRLLGQSIDGPLKDGESHMRYASYGKGGLLDYGDSHVDIVPSNVFAYMASHNESTLLTDFYCQYLGKGTAELLSRVLWEDQIRKTSNPPTLPQGASKLFDQRGIVVLRDSWSPDATVVSMRAGANFNHNHADEGSIFFARGGSLWLGEAGYADYYKDPSYASYNIQAAGHNTLLLDGDTESQSLAGNKVFGSSPQIKQSLLGIDASLVQADLTSVYRGKLQSYKRTLFFQANGPLVVIDQIHSSEAHVFTQVWHPKQKIISLSKDANSLQLMNGDAKLEMETFSTVPIQTSQHDSPMPLASYEKAEHESVERPVEVDISSASAHENAAIVTTFTPRDTQSIALVKPTWEKLPDGFLLHLGTSGIRVQEVPGDTSQSSVSAWWAGGALMLQGERYEHARNHGILQFNHPVNMELKRKDTGVVSLEIEASQSTELTLSKFTVEDESGKSDKDAAGVLHLGVGHSTITLRELVSPK